MNIKCFNNNNNNNNSNNNSNNNNNNTMNKFNQNTIKRRLLKYKMLNLSKINIFIK